MGTSLSVSPFNKLVSQANKDADLILINREKTRFDFTKGKRRLYIQGDCDDVVTRILGDVGWLLQFN